MAREMLQYRGSLKSCNYSCSYCPFAKRQEDAAELAADKKDLLRFCKSVEERQEPAPFSAVMIVPYGEALIHSYYWEGMARLSCFDRVEAVGAQTNLSFPVSAMLRLYDSAGGNRRKLRLWATFHPEMVSVSHFAAQCRELLGAGVRLSAGAVGVPENLELIRGLRRELPADVYLWINRMDGLNRRYTREEQAAFQEIDPYFSQELHWMKADARQCGKRRFVEADGQTGPCNISRRTGGNWYDPNGHTAPPECGRKLCTCYLAYGGRADFENRKSFGRYPLFRIPWRPKAIFFDIDGTLVPDGWQQHDGISREWAAYLRERSKDTLLFLATSLPYESAVKKCGEVFSLFSGGFFASGAHILLFGKEGRQEQEFFCDLDDSWISAVAGLTDRCRIYRYQHGDKLYKLTLAKPHRLCWSEEERSAISKLLPSDSVRCFVEGNCLQIVSINADKGRGVCHICELLGIDSAETEAVGNSDEDLPMFRVCGYGIAAPGSGENVKARADLVMVSAPSEH